MNAFDTILLVVGLGLLGLCVYLRLIRALLLALSVGIAIVPAGLLYATAAHYLAALGQGATLEALVFFLMSAIFTVIIFLITKWAIPDSTLPSLGFLDFVLGGVVGLVFVVLVLMVIMVALGHGINVPGANALIFNWWSTSGLRPWLNLVLQIYDGVAGFFFIKGIPPILIPR